MLKRWKKGLAVFLACFVLITMGLPLDAIAESMIERKFTRFVPVSFNPEAGETTTVEWNFEWDQMASVKIYRDNSLVRTLFDHKSYPGGYVTNRETWDGRDDSGNIVPSGMYRIKIVPLDDKWSKYPSEASVWVSNSAATDIAIEPNLYSSYFRVYGSAEENTEKVEVYLNGELYGEAEINETTWETYVYLPAYINMDITAIKTNMIPEVPEEGEEVGDIGEGNNEAIEGEIEGDMEGEEGEISEPVLVPEETELGPIRVLNHIVRPYDQFTQIAEHYYGNGNSYGAIINDNHLSYPYVVDLGSSLLIFDAIRDGEPEKSEFYDPENMQGKCGLVDLLTNNTVFSEDPVNLATGNFIYSHEDISIGGSFPISFSRFYNSRNQYQGDLGMNWNHSFEYRLQDMGSGRVEIIFSDGHREVFKRNSEGDYVGEVGKQSTLVKNNDQTYTLIEHNQWQYRFNIRGQLIELLDANGNKTTLVYEGMVLREVRTDSGYLIFQYYNNAKIRKISDGTGGFVEYSYSGNQLTSFKDWEGNEVIYLYDGQNRMTEIISPQRDGSIQNVYDEKGRVVEQTIADGNKMFFEYDEENKRTILTERNGRQTIYQYDERYRITEIIYDNGVEKSTFNEKNQRISSTDRNGHTYLYGYDEGGNMTTITDPKGNVTRYAYDNNNRMTAVEKPDGATYSFQYDAKGNLLLASDPTGRNSSYQYNEKGLPIKLIQADGSIVEIKYDIKGNVKEAKDPMGNITKFQYDNLNRLKTVIDPKGNQTNYEYTATGKTKKVTDAEGNTGEFVYNANGKLIKIIDQEKQVTEYRYNQADQVIEVIDPLQGSTQFQYDSMGNVAKVIDAKGSMTEYIYDPYNRLIAVIDPENYTTTFEYDANGNLIKAVDPEGNSNQLYYDELNQLVKVLDGKEQATEYEYDLVGRLTKLKDAMGNETLYQYDEAGRVISITDPMENETTFTYNLQGLLETVTDPLGAVTTYEYNFNGDLVRLMDAEGAITTWEYDANGNVIKVVDAKGNATSYTYDSLNRVKSITNPIGETSQLEYTPKGQISAVVDGKGNRTIYQYDALGNLIEVVDAKGHSTKYTYDSLGNLKEVHQYREIQGKTLDGFTVAEYTLATSIGENSITIDNEIVNTTGSAIIAEVTNENPVNLLEGVNPYGVYENTSYEYDKRGLLTQVKDARGMVTYYQYDGNGNLISMKDRDGNDTNYNYDPNNLLKTIHYSDGKSVEFQHNPLGQVIEMKDWLGVNTYDLDPLGRVLKVTDFEKRTIEYTWTATGLKESIKYPDESQVFYRYDKLGRLTEVEDALGKITNYQYDPIGNVLERILPNGSATKYQYDPANRIKELTEIDPAGNILDKIEYVYDAVGNKSQITKKNFDDDQEKWETEVTNYQYDPLNQLTTVMKNSGEVRKYFYDTLGNRIRLEEWKNGEIQDATNYQYELGNRLAKTFGDYLTPEGYSNLGEATWGEDEGVPYLEYPDTNFKDYHYDHRGNLTRVNSGDTVLNKYEFDPRNQLTEVINKHNEQTKYTYDGLGNRVQTRIDLDRPGNKRGNAYGHDKNKENSPNGNAYGHDKNGNPKAGWGHQFKRDVMEMNYVVDITSAYKNVLMTYGNHYQTQRYIYGIERISMDFWELDDHDTGWIPKGANTNISGEHDRLYYLYDELGSVTRLIGENGKTSSHFNYDEFGKPLSARKFDQNWPGPDNTFGYTGYQYDFQSELYYAQARYYMPEIGRFISEDPWPGVKTVPTTMNPYPYVLNNPMKYVDPLGLAPEPTFTPDGGGRPSRSSNPVNSTINQTKEQNNKGASWNGCDKEILTNDDYTKIRILQFLFAHTDNKLLKDALHFEAARIRQQDKYKNRYNEGEYFDNYNYTYSIEVIGQSVDIHFHKLSLDEAEWLNGTFIDASSEAAGVFGPLVSLIAGLFTAGIAKIPASEGDWRVVVTWGSEYSKNQIEYYFDSSTYDYYHMFDWGKIDIQK